MLHSGSSLHKSLYNQIQEKGVRWSKMMTSKEGMMYFEDARRGHEPGMQVVPAAAKLLSHFSHVRLCVTP